MLQVRLYEYPSRVKHALEQTFGDNQLYFFSSLPNVIGIGFSMQKGSLNRLAEKTNDLGLEPILFTANKFIGLIEGLVQGRRKITSLKFNVKIDDQENDLIHDLLGEGRSAEATELIKTLLSSGRVYISNVSWLEVPERPVELQLWEHGIMYVNDGTQALRSSDALIGKALSGAVSLA